VSRRLVVAAAVVIGLALTGAADAAQLLITNTKSASVSIIDTNTFEVTGTIPVGQGKPNRIVFHPNGRHAWVVYDKSHDLGIIDADTRTLVKRVKVGGNPYNLNFSPDGRYLYVLDWSSDTSGDEVVVYDLATERVEAKIEVSTWPAHSVFSRDGTRLYVSGETAGDVTVIDTVTRAITARLVHGGGDAMGLALTADGKTLYAAAGENRAIVKIDTATHRVVGTIALPGIVHDAVLTLDGKHLYTTLRRDHRLAVVSTADERVVATVALKGYPDLVTMDPAGRHAFVTLRHANRVGVIDVTTHKEIRSIPVGRAPHGMALRLR
jgi:YVTN family beta-propeller protein